MTTVRDIAEPLAGICVAVPYNGDGVCRWCHGHPGPDYSLCFSCAQTRRQLSDPCERIVPVTLYEVPSQLHRVLRYYKDGQNQSLVDTFSLQVASLLCHFLGRHRQCIVADAGTDWEVITSVPSTARQGDHPFVGALTCVPGVYATYEDLLRRGNAAIDHNQANDDGFRTIRRLDGERVLLVDDTFTSGARAQSAASALSNAGAKVVAIVPIGRVINPGFGTNADWWAEQKRVGFSFDTCCLEPC